MAKHLTDKQKKKIIADYAECENYSQVARKHKVSFDTVKRTVLNDPETVKKTEQKKEQNTTDILAHMEKRKGDVCLFIDKALQAMTMDAKIGGASLREIATAMGIVIDKFAPISKSEPAIERLDAILAELDKGMGE